MFIAINIILPILTVLSVVNLVYHIKSAVRVYKNEKSLKKKNNECSN